MAVPIFLLNEVTPEIGDFILLTRRAHSVSRTKWFSIRELSPKIVYGTSHREVGSMKSLPRYSIPEETYILKWSSLADLPEFRDHFNEFEQDFPESGEYTSLIKGVFYRQTDKLLRYCPDCRTRGKEVLSGDLTTDVKKGDAIYNLVTKKFMIHSSDRSLREKSIVVSRDHLPYDFYRRHRNDLIYHFNKLDRTFTQFKQPYDVVSENDSSYEEDRFGYDEKPSRSPILDVIIGDIVFNRSVGFQVVTEITEDFIVCRGPSIQSSFVRYREHFYLVPPSMMRGKPEITDPEDWNYDEWMSQFVTYEFPHFIINPHMIEE